MTIRKVADIIIRASPNGRSTVSGSGIKFYSYDKNSAAIDFHFFDQDNKPTDLMNAKVSLLLLTEENGEWKEFAIIDNGLEVLSEMEGTARYIIPENLRGYIGTVQGYVYLNYNDGSRSDECYFDFKMERSKIEEEFESAGGYYIKEIEDSLDEVIAHLKEYAQEKIVEYNEEFADLNAQILAAQNAIGETQTDITALNAKILELQNKQSAIEKLIADNDVATKTDLENAKAESSANVVYQIVGKEVEIKLTSDFSAKVRGSLAENGNVSKLGAFASMPTSPAGITYEITQGFYDSLNKLDGVTNWAYTKVENQFAAWLFEYDLIDIITRTFTEKFWTGLGADTMLKKTTLLKNMIIGSVTSSVWAKGTSKNGAKVSVGNYLTNNTWSSAPSLNTTSSLKMVTTYNSASSCVQNDGKVKTLVYAEVSDGTEASTVTSDYASIEFTLKLSVHGFINSMIAQYHRENVQPQITDLAARVLALETKLNQ